MGKVAVIGAGVAGIQAALDIANHGVQVYLIEKEPSIGGHMAQLDKTFPTNDCSMCHNDRGQFCTGRGGKFHSAPDKTPQICG